MTQGEINIKVVGDPDATYQNFFVTLQEFYVA